MHTHQHALPFTPLPFPEFLFPPVCQMRIVLRYRFFSSAKTKKKKHKPARVFSFHPSMSFIDRQIRLHACMHAQLGSRPAWTGGLILIKQGKVGHWTKTDSQ
mmetsp:Transcript_48577/g.95863  ORF Transcript_48577/g.95863 Transcript_48577/m.95863 type:complete len:102 (-) Transcript_48577:897-1202(-)